LKASLLPPDSPTLVPLAQSRPDLRNALLEEFSTADFIGVATAIRQACRTAPVSVQSAHANGFPLAHAIGIDRYTGVHDRVLTLNRPGFKCVAERHPYGASTCFTSIETLAVRALIRKFQYRGEIQKNNPFWESEHSKQNANVFDFGDARYGAKIIAEIGYGVDGDDETEVAFIEARFPDGLGGYYFETVDILAIADAPSTVPVESVGDSNEPSVRKEKAKPVKKHA
jgi:hypothetical protein